MIVSLILFLFVGINLYSQEPSIAPSKNTQIQQDKRRAVNKKANAQQKTTSKPIPSAVTPITNQTNQNTDGGNAKGDDNAKTNRMIAWFTGVLALAAIVQLFTTLVQLRRLRQSVNATKDATSATERSANATLAAAHATKRSVDNISRIERAYIFTTVGQHPSTCEPVHGVDGFKGIYAFNATVTLWNVGRTPAIITKIRAVISLGKAIIPEIKESEIPSGIVVGSDKWKNLPTVSFHINEMERQNIYNRNIVAYCCGRIEYEDVFRDKYIRGFCWEYSPHDSRPSEPWIISHRYKDLNYEKEQEGEN